MKEYIWGKRELDELVDRFLKNHDVGITLGSDYILLPYAIQFEIEYLKFMREYGQLSEKEFQKAAKKLAEANIEKIDLTKYEDLHSYIDDILHKVIGKSIYICRSRNDVIATVERLFFRDYLLQLTNHLKYLVNSLETALLKSDEVIAPAFTHYRLADLVPLSSYFTSYIEELFNIISYFKGISTLIFTSPIGSSAIGGCPLEINFIELSRRLGFKYTHSSSLEGINSRKRVFSQISYLNLQLSTLYARISRDLIKLSDKSIEVVSIAKQHLTGSSQLIHKENPDILEIFIGLHRKILSTYTLSSGISSEETGYQRHLQIVKKEVLKDCMDILDSTKIISSIISNLEFTDYRGETPNKATWLATILAWKSKTDYRKIYNLLKEYNHDSHKKIINEIEKITSLNKKEIEEIMESINRMRYNKGFIIDYKGLLKAVKDELESIEKEFK